MNKIESYINGEMYLVCKYIYDTGTTKSILFSFDCHDMARKVVKTLTTQQRMKEDIHALLRKEYPIFKQSFFATLIKNQYTPEKIKEILTQQWRDKSVTLVKEHYGDFSVLLLESEVSRNINFMFGMESYPMIRYETENVAVLNSDNFTLLDLDKAIIF